MKAAKISSDTLTQCSKLATASKGLIALHHLRKKKHSLHAKRKTKKRGKVAQVEEIPNPSYDDGKLRYVNKDNWREALKPIVLDDDEYGSEYSVDDRTGEQVKKVCNQPDQRLRRFDPIPDDDRLHWIYYYFFPYSRTFNTARCMSFACDERKEQIKRMRQLYQAPQMSQIDKMAILDYIKAMQLDHENTHYFKDDRNCTWHELFSNFIVTKDHARRERIMKLFDKLSDLEEGVFEMPRSVMATRQHFRQYLERKHKLEMAQRRAKSVQPGLLRQERLDHDDSCSGSSELSSPTNQSLNESTEQMKQETRNVLLKARRSETEKQLSSFKPKTIVVTEKGKSSGLAAIDEHAQEVDTPLRDRTASSKNETTRKRPSRLDTNKDVAQATANLQLERSPTRRVHGCGSKTPSESSPQPAKPEVKTPASGKKGN